MFDKEPAVIVSSITAFLTAVIGVAVAFGVEMDDDQQTAVISVVAPVVALIFLLGPIIRTFVYSPDSVQKKVDEAAITALRGETPSPVVP